MNILSYVDNFLSSKSIDEVSCELEEQSQMPSTSKKIMYKMNLNDYDNFKISVIKTDLLYDITGFNAIIEKGKLMNIKKEIFINILNEILFYNNFYDLDYKTFYNNTHKEKLGIYYNYYDKFYYCISNIFVDEKNYKIKYNYKNEKFHEKFYKNSYDILLIYSDLFKIMLPIFEINSNNIEDIFSLFNDLTQKKDKNNVKIFKKIEQILKKDKNKENLIDIFKIYSVLFYKKINLFYKTVNPNIEIIIKSNDILNDENYKLTCFEKIDKYGYNVQIENYKQNYFDYNEILNFIERVDENKIITLSKKENKKITISVKEFKKLILPFKFETIEKEIEFENE